MAGVSRAYKRRGNMIANTGGPVLCLDAGSRLSYPGSGTAWTDLSGNGNTGTLTNGPTYSSANGGSIVFDGTDDYVSVPVNSNLQFGSTDFTISIILNFSSLVGYKTVIGNYYGGSTETWVLQSITGTGKMAFYINGAGASVTSSDVFSTNEFSLLTCSRSSGTMTMYKNQNAIGSGSVGTIGSSSSAVFICARDAHRFNGLISNVSIYNRALSAAEISTNFNLLRGRYFKVTPSVEYLVVAGGGGGASLRGGGGAGGLLTAAGFAVASGTPITVTIGGGGAAGSHSIRGTNGSNSVFSSIAPTGGGGAGAYDGTLTTANGKDGGSGGGAGAYDSLLVLGTGGLGTSGQGNNGGNALSDFATYTTSGGGGGAGAAGNNGTISAGGNGGVGLASTISGSTTFYAGGGGGCTGGVGPTNGLGGNGGGGNAPSTAGTANTGGGGGGAAGGSGIVIIRYPDFYSAAASTTGSPTITVAGGYRVYSWTGSGTITF